MRYFHVTPSTLETSRRDCEAFLRWYHQELVWEHKAFINNKAPLFSEASCLWCHQESNRGHKDFQSFALPTELWHLFSFASAKVGLIFDMAKYSVDNFEIRRVREGMAGRRLTEKGVLALTPCGAPRNITHRRGSCVQNSSFNISQCVAIC